MKDSPGLVAIDPAGRSRVAIITNACGCAVTCHFAGPVTAAWCGRVEGDADLHAIHPCTIMTCPVLRVLSTIADVNLTHAFTVISEGCPSPGPGAGRRGNGARLKRCNDRTAGISELDGQRIEVVVIEDGTVIFAHGDGRLGIELSPV